MKPWIRAEACGRCRTAANGNEFCVSCGRLLVRGSPARSIPEVPEARRNPLLVLSDTLKPPEDPRSLPRPESVQQKIFAERQRRSSLFDEESVLAAAEAEFSREVVPLLLAGSMKPVVLDAWNRHWRFIDQSVSSLREFLEDEHLWGTDGVFDTVRDRLGEELASVIDGFEGVLADVGPLMAFEFRAKGTHAALEHVSCQIETLRLGEALAAMTWMRDLVDSGMQAGVDLEDLHELQQLVERAAEHSESPRDRLHRTLFVSNALVARFESLEAALADFAAREPDLATNAQVWLACAARRLIPSDAQLLDSVLAADDAQAFGMQRSLTRQIERLLAAFLDEAQYRAESLQQDREREWQQAEEDRQERRHRAALQAQKDLIDYALEQQQYLRQQSQGKHGLALTTKILGAESGAMFEGMFR